MTISDIASYVTTADEFMTHWADVDADRVASTLPVLVVQGGFGLTEFTVDRDALQAAIVALEGLGNALDLAASDRDSAKTNLSERLSQFRAAVRKELAATRYPGTMATIPQATLAESKFLRAFDDTADLWLRINADTTIPGFTGPLLLRAGYTQASFATDLAATRTEYQSVRAAENDLTIARRQRDEQLDPLKERMFQYRAAIELEYGPGHAFYDSLPDITPSPGSTPDAVTLSGQWNSSPGSGLLSWNESTSPNVDHYLVRFSPGATYDSGSSSISANLPPGTTTHETLDGLASPGDVASFKVFVVLTTGNQAGSNTATITRP